MEKSAMDPRAQAMKCAEMSVLWRGIEQSLQRLSGTIDAAGRLIRAAREQADDYAERGLVLAEELGIDEEWQEQLDKLLRERRVICPECGVAGFIYVPATDVGEPSPATWERCDCWWGRQRGIEPPEY